MTGYNLESLRRLPLDRCFEFIAPTADMTLLARDMPVEPGSLLRNDAGDAELLHIAPRRWLVPRPAAALEQRLVDWQTAGQGHLIDVTGKWQSFRLEGEGGMRVLESTVNLHALLEQRACAATFLFDCPTIITREGGTFDLWIAASYVESFLDSVGALRFVAG